MDNPCYNYPAMKPQLDLPTVAIILTVLSFLLTVFSITRNRILWSMGLRNAFKRKSTTLLLIIGSLVGTALITGSQVINDSFQYTSRSALEDSLGEVDATVRSQIPTGFNRAELNRLEKELRKLDSVDDVADLNVYEVSLQKVVNGEKLSLKSNVKLSAANWEILNNFGDDPSLNEAIREPESGKAYITQDLARSLDIKKGDLLSVYVTGSELQVEVQELIKGSGVTGPSQAGHLIVNKHDIQMLLNLLPDSANTLYVSHVGGILPDDSYDPDQFTSEIEDAVVDANLREGSYEVIEQKDTLQQRVTGNGTDVIFTAMSIFGAFAGALLIVNIFLMLAEERKSEMGILRAIGLSRADLIKAFLYEGMIYASLSSLAGMVVGIGIGYLIVMIISQILGQFLSIFGVNAQILFDVTTNSLLVSFSAGFLFTFITTLMASYFISNVNIVSAIRDIPEEKLETKFKSLIRWSYRMILVIIGVTMYSYAGKLQENASEGMNIEGSLQYMGIILTIIGAMLLITRMIQQISHSRTERLLNRLIVSISSLSITIYSLYVTSNDTYVESLQENPVFFFFVGLGIVIGSVVFVSYNLGILTFFIQFIFRPMRRFIATVTVAVKYPAFRPTRTGITLTIYAVILFLITFISIQRSSLDLALERGKDSVLGSYDGIVLITTPENIGPVETVLKNDPNTVLVITGKTVKAVFPDEQVQSLSMEMGPPILGDEITSYVENLYLASDEYFGSTQFKFGETYQNITDDQVWEKMKNEPDDWVILSGKYGIDLPFFPKWQVGDKISFVIPPSEQKITRTVLAKVDSEFGSRLPYGDIVLSAKGFPISTEELGGSSDTILFSLIENVDPASYASIKDEIAKEGEFNLVIAEEVITTFQAFIKQFIYLMQGFLSFALLVGLAGLSIIMLRSVNERRQQIGMLRSLGFSRGMILNAFLIESSLIGLAGITIGSVTGLIGGNTLITTVTGDFEGFEVNLPYMETFLIGLVIYIGTVIFTAWPAIKAARLHPVEATNYPE